ncbi:MAG: RNA-guided pseudouridylation complex pseudouridine synthase subunit Cbf5 [Candidatus Micrarchaeota archaeon]
MIKLQDAVFNWGEKPSERSMQDRLRYGVFVLDKPCGPSSHEASAFVRKILHLNKAGHSGTLDPDVSGVLPVLLENSCKAAPFLLKERKQYVCIMRMNEEKNRKEVEEAFSHFRGKIYQKPPLESAVAKRLRIREVFSLDIMQVEGKDVLFSCDVEGGFYVRKLCTDVGEVLGCGAVMDELRRTKAAGFTEAQARTLQTLSDAYWFWIEKKDDSHLKKLVMNLEDAIELKRVVVDDTVIRPITTGANLAAGGIISLDEGIKREENVQILSGKGELLCFAKALSSTEEIVSAKSGLAFDISRVVKA